MKLHPVALFLMTMLAWGVPLWAQDTAGTGTLRATISDATGTAAKDVAVCVPATSQCGVTGADGTVVIAVRAGTYTLEVAVPGRPLVVTDPVQVRAGLVAVVAIALPADEGISNTVTVTAPAFVAPEEVKTSSFLAGRRAVAETAGALEDVSRYVQSLPGVAIASNDFRNDLIVRGGSPLENLYVVDNIEIPNINTFATFASAGGTVSVLDVQLLENVTFLTGGFPAPYGNRTSSVLQVTQREGRRDRVSGTATVAFAGAGGVVEGPIGSARKGSWVLSARRSFLDLFTDDTGIGGVPVLYTLNGKAVYDISARDRVWAVNLTGVDSVRLGATEDSDPTEELSNLDIRYEGWRTASGVNWQRLFSGGVSLFGVTYSRATVGQRVTDLIRNGVPPPGTPVEEQIAAGALVFREESSESDTTVKYDLTFATPLLDKVQVGGNVKWSLVDYDTASPYGADNPFFPVANANPFTISETFTTWQAGAYAQATHQLTGRLNLTAGARADHYGFTSRTRVSPRIGAEYRLAPGLTLRAAAGQYYQQPFFLFLAAYPENRALPPFRADHYVAGVAFAPAAGTRLSLEVYRKNYRHYPVSTQIPSLSLANVGDTFAVRDTLFPMTGDGRGKATGLEAYVSRARPGGRWSADANLAVSRAEFSGNDGVLRAGSFDYPVVANANGTWNFAGAWSAGLRTSYLAGRPFTPIDAALSTAQRRTVYDLAQVNARRLPDYFRLDLRIARAFRRGGGTATIFAGVQNVTDRRNVSGYAWDRRANVERTNDQLGIFPILGVEWPF